MLNNEEERETRERRVETKRGKGGWQERWVESFY